MDEAFISIMLSFITDICTPTLRSIVVKGICTLIDHTNRYIVLPHLVKVWFVNVL